MPELNENVDLKQSAPVDKRYSHPDNRPWATPQEAFDSLEYKFDGMLLNIATGLYMFKGGTALENIVPVSGGEGGGATDLGYTLDADGITITSSTGAGIKLPFATTQKPGVLSPENLQQLLKAADYTLVIEANVLKLLKEGVVVSWYDLSLYLDDTNLARLVDGNIDENLIAHFVRDDDSEFTIDFSPLLGIDASGYIYLDPTKVKIKDVLSDIDNKLDSLEKRKLSEETDPVFQASPAGSITDEKKNEWDAKLGAGDAIPAKDVQVEADAQVNLSAGTAQEKFRAFWSSLLSVNYNIATHFAGAGNRHSTRDIDHDDSVTSLGAATAYDALVKLKSLIDDIEAAREETDPTVPEYIKTILQSDLDKWNAYETSINAIIDLLGTDDTTLDELQEIVDYIKLNRADLENLNIAAIAGLQSALDAKLTGTAATAGDMTTGTSTTKFGSKKLSQKIFQLNRVKLLLDEHTRQSFFYAYIEPCIDYASTC